jgi:hypothetical protein
VAATLGGVRRGRFIGVVSNCCRHPDVIKLGSIFAAVKIELGGYRHGDYQAFAAHSRLHLA